MIDVFAHIKAYLPISRVFEHYGIKVSYHNKAICPFHNEKTPSLVLYSDTNSFNCFGCGVGGDAVTLVGKLYGLNPLEAAQKIDEDFSLGLFHEEPSPGQKRELANRIKKQEAGRQLVAALDTWSNWAFDSLCNCKRLMESDMQFYAPKSEARLGQFHPRYLLAAHWLEYVCYLSDMLIFADFETKLTFYNKLHKEVEQFAKYADSSRASGEDAQRIISAIA